MFNPIKAQREARQCERAARRASELGDHAHSRDLHLKAAGLYADISAWAAKGAFIGFSISALIHLYQLLTP